MKMNNDRKMWSKPTITSVEHMKSAAGGNHTGVAKDGTVIEYQYAGSGS